MRFEDLALNERLRGLVLFLPFFLLYAAVIYFFIGLHRNKWRFTSIPDLYNLFRVDRPAISLLALDYILVAPNLYGTFFAMSILLYWFLQMFFLGGLRVIYRYPLCANAATREGCRRHSHIVSWDAPPTRKYCCAASKAAR